MSLAIPTQLQTEDHRSPVIAEVWLKLRREHIPGGNGYRHLQYAFKTATLYLECKDCNIDGTTRLETVVYRLTEKRTETGESEYVFEGSGEIRARVEGLLKLIDAHLNARAELRDTAKHTRQAEGEMVREYRSVWSAGKESWCLVGLKNEDGIITDRVCGDDPICSVENEGDKARITARVVVDMRDLWVAVDETVDGAEFEERAGTKISNNKRAVCAALVKRGRPDSARALYHLGIGEIELARATVQRVKAPQ